MTSSTGVQWRVQTRKSKAHKWVNKGLFETRDAARLSARLHRSCYCYEGAARVEPRGFGNTRIVRYVRGEK